MTLDCDAQTLTKINDLLQRAQDDGLLYYGISEQEQAIMTCIVPSITTDDHIHFIDGANGGYTRAAVQLKAALA